MIVVNGELRGIIHDVWGSLTACAEHTDRRIMDFRKRPCPSVIRKVSAQDLRDAEDEMPMGNLFEDIAAQPLPELHHPLLMA